MSQCNGFNFGFGVSSVVELGNKATGGTFDGFWNTKGLEGVVSAGGFSVAGRQIGGAGIVGFSTFFGGGGGGGGGGVGSGGDSSSGGGGGGGGGAETGFRKTLLILGGDSMVDIGCDASISLSKSLSGDEQVGDLAL